jgi:hypothetical protein
MPTFTKKQAVKAITEEIRKASLDDLVEYFNELFPRERTTLAAGPDPRPSPRGSSNTSRPASR